MDRLQPRPKTLTEQLQGLGIQGFLPIAAQPEPPKPAEAPAPESPAD